MKVYLRDQSRFFPQHLELLKRQPVMHYNVAELREQITSIPISTRSSLQNLDTSPLFKYNIFPGRIMTHLAQWAYENREIRVGDTIVQQVFIPPFRGLSQKMIFGARVSEIIKETSRIGFRYETLQGHVEKGISTFLLEKKTDRELLFKIHTLSAPGNLLAGIVAPVFGNAYQSFCTRKGLLNVKRQLEQLS